MVGMVGNCCLKKGHQWSPITCVHCELLQVVLHELFTLPQHMSSPPVFSGVRVARSLVFCVIFCRFFVWPLRCLTFDIRLLVTPLVSSNFTWHQRAMGVTFSKPRHPFTSPSRGELSNSFFPHNHPIPLSHRYTRKCKSTSYIHVLRIQRGYVPRVSSFVLVWLKRV